jgi:hypothetical protein
MDSCEKLSNAGGLLLSCVSQRNGDDGVIGWANGEHL